MKVLEPVIIPGWLPVRELGLNGNSHWRTRLRARDDAMNVLMPVLANARWPEQVKGGPRRRVTVTLHHWHAWLDTDNLYTRCKVIFDALKPLSYLVDDSPLYCELVTKQERGKKVNRRTVIELEEIGETP